MLSDHDSTRRIPWRSLLVEAAFVVLSVLLALTLNNWHQDRTNRELARQALLNMKQEIRANRAEVEKVLPRQRALLDTLAGPHPPLGATIGAATIENNAWGAAQAMGAIPYLDPAVVSIASRIQETQRRYQNAVETMDGIMIRGTFGAGGDAFSLKRIPEGIRVMVSELYGQEQRLLEEYDQALTEMGSSASANRPSASPAPTSEPAPPDTAPAP